MINQFYSCKLIRYLVNVFPLYCWRPPQIWILGKSKLVVDIITFWYKHSFLLQ